MKLRTLNFVRTFIAECVSEGILKICQYLVDLRQKLGRNSSLGPPCNGLCIQVQGRLRLSYIFYDGVRA